MTRVGSAAAAVTRTLHRCRARGATSHWRLRAQYVILAAGITAGGTAAADSVEIVEPQSGTLLFEHTPFDVPSLTQRIRIRNGRTATVFGSPMIAGHFLVSPTPGMIGPGEEAIWDISCFPDEPGMISGFFDFNWCTTDCGAEGRVSVSLRCTGGFLFPAQITTLLPVVFAYEVSQAPVRWTNTGSDPVVVTGFSFSNSAFTAAPESGTLPRTVLPGESLVTTVTFDTTSQPTGQDVNAHFDVMAGAAIVGRADLLTMVLKQITNVAATPITVPIVVTGDAFALVGQDAIPLAAGASADITVEFQPTTAGSYSGTLELGTPGDRDHVVVPLMGTARPPMVQCDTALAFGDVRVGSTAALTLTITISRPRARSRSRRS